jgi:Trypsin-co-occurring domain 1
MFGAVEFTLDDGATVVVAPPARTGSGAVGLDDRVEAAGKTLRQALAPVTAAAAQVMDGFRKMAECPAEVEISFGVTLDGRLGGIIASAEAGTHLDVTLRWRGPGPAPAGTASQDTPATG